MVDIAALARLGGVRKYGTDEMFFHFGDPGHEMFIILKGHVGVYINSLDGSPLQVAALKDGDFFGEMSLLENMPRSATISALEDTVCLVIDESNFEQVIAQQPSLAFRIMKGMSNRLRQQNEELSFLKQGSKPEEDGAVAGAASTSAPVPLSSDIYPPGHKSYPLSATSAHDIYLFDSETLCPVCDKKFPVKMVRSSKLRLDKIDPDLRQHFHDFEPLWYAAWICPHCYYTNFNFEFKQVSDALIKKIIEQGQELKSKVKVDFSSPRRIDEVFTSYYMILQTLQAGKVEPTKSAKIWLRLSWLYSDVEDEEMFNYTSEKALEAYSESYFNTRRNTSVEQDQRLTILLGELCLRVNQKEEALKHFRNSIVRKGGNNNLNRQAEDRIHDLRIALSEENT
ncbi:MAG: DUF2225 domain-containing protein [Syntrophomonadaceae bacterium]|nr:DUF2225 domain-containing protein [Syntrophomonadaceae bacterium]MDD4561760.1 DUF2225 domain-containing protein [Syntrophomonadaceae bacterium]